MTIPAWDSNLPQTLFVNGYSEAVPNVLERSTMDAGPAKQRRRFTAGVRPVTGTMVMTAAELDDFREFFNEDLLGGSLRFSWVDPVDGTTAVEMRFTEPPGWSAIDAGLYSVGMSLEILP